MNWREERSAYGFLSIAQLLLLSNRLTFVAENVGQPEGSGGVKKMTDLRNQAVKAFIGPDESCFAEALVADAWNMPMITYVSMPTFFF